MDIALKFKRAIATLSAGTLFASLLVVGTGTASAQTFSDVKPGMWSYEYVEKGVADGYFDKNANFRPTDPVQRDEAAKTLSVIMDCKAGFTDPVTGTFKDVLKGWSYSHIECLAAKGILTGDTDPVTKKPTGFFRPADPIKRSEAVKMIVSALKVEMDLDPASKFTDVTNKAEWYYNYVVAAYNQSVIDGYKDAQGKLTGKFGPADNITREQWAKLLVTGQNPTPREPEPCDPNALDCPGPKPTPSNGDLEVSLNANTPKLDIVPKKANGVDVLKFDVSAVKDDVTLTGVVVKRSGAGDKNDIAAAYLYEGDTRMTSERTLSSDTQEVAFTLKNFVVKTGATRTLTLVVDISDTAASNNQHMFSIVSAEKVTHNGVKTTGDFPVDGDSFTIGGVEVSDITIEEGSAPSKAQLGGTAQKVASLKITAGINDVNVERLAVTNGGSQASEDLANCKLMRASDELAMTKALVGDILTFDLAKPFLIEEGQSRTFDVTCDIIGGRPGDDIIFYLDTKSDLKAVDVDYGFGANVVNNFTQSDANTVEIEGGVVTVIKEGPAATDIAQNTTNNVLMNYSVIAERDLTVRDTGIEIQLEAAGNGPDVTTLGSTTAAAAGDTSSLQLTAVAGFEEGDTVKFTAASGTVYAVITNIVGTTISTDLAAGDTVANASSVVEVNPYTFIENVKVIDADTKATIIDPVTDATTGATLQEGVAPAGDSYYRTHPQDYELFAGKERNFALMIDLDGNMPAGYQLRGLVYYAPKVEEVNSFIKDEEANKMVPSEDVVVSPVVGNYMFTAENTVSVGKANTPTSNNFVKGDPEVEALGISLTAGDAGDTRINSLKLRVYGCDDTDDTTGANATPGVQCFADTTGVDTGLSTSWENILGNKAANTIISTIKLVEGNTEVAAPVNVKLVNVGGGAGYDAGTDYYMAEFDGLDMIIKAGQTRTLTAVANSLNVEAGTTHLAVDLNPADIDAEDAEDANAITVSGSALNIGIDKSPLITFGQGGALTATSEGNPNAGILLFNAQKQLVSKYKFDAQDEDYLVKRLTVMNDLTGDFDVPVNTNAVNSIVLKYTKKDGTVVESLPQPLVGGKATFSALDFYIPAGQSKYLEVLVNLNGMNVDDITGTHLRVALQNIGNTQNTFEAIGQGSQESEYFDDPASIINPQTPKDFVLRRTMPTFKQNSTPSLLAAGAGKELFDFDMNVAAANTSVDLARMVFDVTVTGTTVLSSLQLTRNDVVLDANDVSIIRADNNANLQGAGTLPAGTYKVIVSMVQSNPITASTNFKLKASVATVGAGDTVSVRLSDDDETTEPSEFNALPNQNGNTGKLVDVLTDVGIFASATDFAQSIEGDAGVQTTAGVNFVWSDSSDQPHVFSTTSAASSRDFTNGYRLRVNAMNEVVISE